MPHAVGCLIFRTHNWLPNSLGNPPNITIWDGNRLPYQEYAYEIPTIIRIPFKIDLSKTKTISFPTQLLFPSTLHTWNLVFSRSLTINQPSKSHPTSSFSVHQGAGYLRWNLHPTFLRLHPSHELAVVIRLSIHHSRIRGLIPKSLSNDP